MIESKFFPENKIINELKKVKLKCLIEANKLVVKCREKKLNIDLEENDDDEEET